MAGVAAIVSLSRDSLLSLVTRASVTRDSGTGLNTPVSGFNMLASDFWEAALFLDTDLRKMTLTNKFMQNLNNYKC